MDSGFRVGTDFEQSLSVAESLPEGVTIWKNREMPVRLQRKN
jgi:hypothetical protein